GGHGSDPRGEDAQRNRTTVRCASRGGQPVEEGNPGTGSHAVCQQAWPKACRARRRGPLVQRDRAPEDGIGLAQRKVRTMNADVRMNWVMQDTSLPITRQCELAQVPRATFYGRRPANLASDEDLLYMRLIDEEYTRHPFYGSRRMVVGRAHV